MLSKKKRDAFSPCYCLGVKGTCKCNSRDPWPYQQFSVRHLFSIRTWGSNASQTLQCSARHNRAILCCSRLQSCTWVMHRDHVMVVPESNPGPVLAEASKLSSSLDPHLFIVLWQWHRVNALAMATRDPKWQYSRNPSSLWGNLGD